MGDYERIISKIRQLARERAVHELDRREIHSGVSAGTFKVTPKFSVEDRAAYIANAEEDAIYRLHMHFIDIALGV